MFDYNIGSIIKYYAFGSYAPRVVEVFEVDSDINDGRPGFAGVSLDPDTLEPLSNPFRYPGASLCENVWGYDDQIVEVLNEGAK